MKTMYTKYFFTIICCSLLLLGYSCCTKNRTNAGTPTQAHYDTLVILSTNDVHAQINNMAKEKAFADKIRSEYSNVLVVGAGDIFSGSPVVDQYPERGYPIIDLMNRLGYQAVAIGNHEFDYGQAVLKQRLEQADFPALCANADFSKTVLKDLVKPYKIFSVNGIKVALLAFIESSNTTGIPSTLPANVKNISFSNALNDYSKYRSLRDSANVFIVLSHLGVEGDSLLAVRFPEPDVIIGGHSHTRLNQPKTVNGVLITQTGSSLSNIGKTVLVLKDGKVESKTNKLQPFSPLTAEDPDIKARITEYNENPALKRVIGRATATFTGKDALGNLMTDAQRELHRLDIALTNNGGIRINSIPEGNITVAKIYELDPFGNDEVVYDMSVAELQDLLKYASRHGVIELQISGAKYTYNKSSKTVQLTDYNNAPLNTAKRYKVGMNSYIAESFMPRAVPSLQGTYLYTTTNGTLVEYIEQEKQVTPQPQRAFVVE